jgi:hypothetical protein
MVEDKVVAVIREWVNKAENDLKAAAQILKLGDECPTDTVCFHAQQCVEKYLKALLVSKGIAFPKIHDVEELVAKVPPRDRPFSPCRTVGPSTISSPSSPSTATSSGPPTTGHWSTILFSAANKVKQIVY